MLKKIFQNPKTTIAGILTLLALAGKLIVNPGSLSPEDGAAAIAALGLIFAGDAKSTN
jgi:hypothetical protein